MNRKVFSQKIFKSVVAIAALTSIPFISNKSKFFRNNESIKVQINPSAVKREKTGSRNV
jgi:hypothetical protein